MKDWLGKFYRYMKAILPVVILFGLPMILHAQAEEKILYCEMTGFVGASDKGTAVYTAERFTMMVKPRTVYFSESSFLGRTFSDGLNIIWSTDDEFRAELNALDFPLSKKYLNTAIFSFGRFQLAGLRSESIFAVSARCDEF